MIRALAAVLLAALAPGRAGAAPAAGESFVYFGTYNGPKSKGIYVSRFDPATRRLTPPGLAAETEGPSFLALHPSRPFLYAVNEIGEFAGEKAGSVSAFAIDEATGRLRLLNEVSSKGAHPCHLVVDSGGRNVLVANYSGGSVASLPIAEDGRLGPASAFVQHRGHGPNAERQAGPHAHAVALDPANRFALAADLGLDQVLVYRFDAARGALDPAEPPYAAAAAGSGPRHLAFTGDGRRLYVLTEMAMTVTGFRYEAGRLTEEGTTSFLPEGVKPGAADSGAEILVHPSGRFLYTSSRGPDALTVFAIDGPSGRLSFVDRVPSGGKTPRSFAIDPSGRVLLAANQRSDSVVAFSIDEASGKLSPTGQVLEVGTPVCIVFRPRPSRPR